MLNNKLMFLFIAVIAILISFWTEFSSAGQLPFFSGGQKTDAPFMADKTLSEIADDMIPIEGGNFMMGGDFRTSNGVPDLHKVRVSSFYMCKYEITQGQWKQLMGNNPSTFKNCPDCPVDSVSWEDAMQFISKLNQISCKHYRLPTEAEWEYAEKGGKKGGTFIYAGSNDINAVGWYDGNSDKKTHPVGQKKPNQLGIYDMTGNVCEWCNDWFDMSNYKNIPAEDPQGPHSGTMKVVRGKSFGSMKQDIIPTLHVFDFPCKRSDAGGFRIARDI
jgi:formylglycine-generating enzyme required for sulfatase activity